MRRQRASTKEAFSPTPRPDQPRQYGRGTGVPHPVDVHVGMRLWQSRRLRGMTQGDLAERLGLTFQQVQKYETGANRVSASRLAAIAGLLEVPIASFFPERGPASGSAGDLQYRDHLLLPETIDLIHYFAAIKDPEVQQSLLALVKTVAAAAPILPIDGDPASSGAKRRARRPRNPKA